jgi:hypothetical protein
MNANSHLILRGIRDINVAQFQDTGITDRVEYRCACFHVCLASVSG